MRPLIVLHGAWHRPAHFDDVAERLRREGADVTVPDIGGLPLAESTRLVQEIVDRATEPPVVLAHSYGGMTASGLRGAGHLLYVAAFVTKAGENIQYWIKRVEQETGREAAPMALTVDDAGLTHLEPGPVRENLYADCTDAVADRAISLLRPEPVTMFTGSALAAAWEDTPSTYLACTEDRAIVPDMFAHFAKRCDTTVTWQTSHSPFLSRPDQFAALVRERL
ncbi:alpha/beta hydrolase [Amycolatopsis samaneae]|uniref:Alpha/beta hydrolase n=1 Tax=Amycolatopsis samaneae TaxID=664691 RepID=A0ABW5GL72_9PSEU